jgi:hypothetical protein
MKPTFYGSICVTDLIEAAKTGNPAFSKAANGKTYVNIIIWHNETPDKFDNTESIQLSKPKDYNEKQPYIGNLKSNGATNQKVNSNDFDGYDSNIMVKNNDEPLAGFDEPF